MRSRAHQKQGRITGVPKFLKIHTFPTGSSREVRVVYYHGKSGPVPNSAMGWPYTSCRNPEPVIGASTMVWVTYSPLLCNKLVELRYAKPNWSPTGNIQ